MKNTEPGPPCPHCRSVRTLLIADAPGMARCGNCGAPFHLPRPAMDNSPGNPTPVSPMAKMGPSIRMEVGP